MKHNDAKVEEPLTPQPDPGAAESLAAPSGEPVPPKPAPPSNVDETHEDGRNPVFDLKKLRLPSDFTEQMGGKVLSTVPPKRPSDHVYFMVSPREDYQAQVGGFLYKGADLQERNNKVLLIVTPSMWQAPELKSGIKPFHLFTAVDTFGNAYVIPVHMDDNEWHRSMFEAMAHAQKEWIRLEAHKTLHGYVRTRGGSLLRDQEPAWPTLSFEELLAIAFKDLLIENDDHVVVKKLRGGVN
ncbi:MAG TPA: hypothetical protein VGY99_20600 [Candidatus Binataceae bacterium]|nr:hypothetical protein [Candidatus Binataceae bacterium]